VVLDVHRPVLAAGGRSDEEVRFADPPAGRIRRQSTAGDEVSTGRHGVLGCFLPEGTVIPAQQDARRVHRCDPREDGCFEIDPASDAACRDR
jgi:hypothetical protein